MSGHTDNAERLSIRNRLQRLGITVRPCDTQYHKALYDADGTHIGDFDAQGAVGVILERERGGSDEQG